MRAAVGEKVAADPAKGALAILSFVNRPTELRLAVFDAPRQIAWPDMALCFTNAPNPVARF